MGGRGKFNLKSKKTLQSNVVLWNPRKYKAAKGLESNFYQFLIVLTRDGGLSEIFGFFQNDTYGR